MLQNQAFDPASARQTVLTAKSVNSSLDGLHAPSEGQLLINFLTGELNLAESTLAALTDILEPALCPEVPQTSDKGSEFAPENVPNATCAITMQIVEAGLGVRRLRKTLTNISKRYKL